VVDRYYGLEYGFFQELSEMGASYVIRIRNKPLMEVVELFFKWLKCILKCRHLLAESERGVAIRIFTALIAALLLQGLTGKRPSKRQMQMIQFHLAGYLSLDELIAALKLEKTKD
jgi:hypothetical protein